MLSVTEHVQIVCTRPFLLPLKGPGNEVSYIASTYVYTHTCTMLSIVCLTGPHPIFSWLRKCDLPDPKNIIHRYGLMSNQHTKGVCKVYMSDCCLKQLSRRVYSPQWAVHNGNLRVLVCYASMEGMWQIIYVPTLIGLLDESNKHTVLETLASTPSSRSMVQNASREQSSALFANQNPRSPL